MGKLEQLAPHSYEHFARLDFNREIDEKLLNMASGRFARHTDLATGYGAVIGHCLRLGKYTKDWLATGVDIDPTGIETARERFADFGNRIRFIKSGVQQPIPEIDPASQDLVTIFNAIHLTDPSLTLGEAARIAKPGATLLVSSAYEKSAMPEPAGRMLMIAMRTARKILEDQGYSEFPKSESLLKYSNDDYRVMAQTAGFTDIEIVTLQTLMNKEVLEAIFDSRDFALGVFPAVPLDAAAAALVSSIDPMLERFERDSIPRNYMLLKATRANTEYMQS